MISNIKLLGGGGAKTVFFQAPNLNLIFCSGSQHLVSCSVLVIRRFYVRAFLNQNGDLVYKFNKLIGRNDFSFQFRKIITSYRSIGYNLKVMQQSACLVFNLIMVDCYAAFFTCAPVGRASDSMIAPI